MAVDLLVRIVALEHGSDCEQGSSERVAGVRTETQPTEFRDDKQPPLSILIEVRRRHVDRRVRKKSNLLHIQAVCPPVVDFSILEASQLARCVRVGVILLERLGCLNPRQLDG
eukprot:2226955-Rhodomonas_salina.2